jgi:outer membrane protein assembly factor BamB
LAIRDNAILWSYVIPVVPPVRTSITSSPIVGLDGHIYFAADDGQLYNVDPQTQTVEPGWPKPVSLAPITSTPLLCQDGVFYVADDDNLYAVNPDGSIRWQVLLTIPPRRGPSFSFEEQPSPLVDQYGIIYIASENGLFAIAGRTTNGGLAQTAWPMFHHDRKHTGKFGAR